MTRSPATQYRHQSRGSILPMIIMISIVTSIVGALALEAMTQAIASQRQQYYTTLADEAAKAGITYVNACIKNKTLPPNSLTPITPKTNCVGAVQANFPDAIVERPDWKSSYEITYDPGTNIINSKGILTRYNDETIVGTPYEQTLKTNIIQDSTPTTEEAKEDNLRFAAISAGEKHTCAISNDKAYCWGANDYGQLGTGSMAPATSDTPQAVAGLTGKIVTSIQAGANHTCAITEANPKSATNEVWCWGRGDGYGLGNGSSTPANQPTPVRAAGGLVNKRITKIALGSGAQGNNACALTSDSATTSNRLVNVYCWGQNNYGQMSTNSTSTQTIPTLAQVRMSTDNENSSARGLPFVDISIGDIHTCGITSDGLIFCWGKNRPSTASAYSNMGTFGIGATDYSTTDYSTGAVSFYGPGSSTESYYYPTYSILNGSHTGGDRATSVASGGLNNCSINGGRVYCWGYNNQGQLGLGTQSSPNITANKVTPVKVESDTLYGTNSAALSVSTNNGTSCAVHTGGLVKCWGANTIGSPGAGRLGTGESVAFGAQPRRVSNLADKQITQVAVGYSHTCAIAGNEGAAYCWGDNSSGQLGNGDTTRKSTNTPTPVTDGPNSFMPASASRYTATAISAGFDHTCAIITMQVYCWGKNNYGQLGTKDYGDQNLPTRINSFVDANKKFTQITSGEGFSCATTITNEIWCWGRNTYKQIGDEDTNTYKPTRVTPPINTVGIRTISAGTNHVCAVIVRVSDEPAYCWGDNSSRQLGAGLSANSVSSPSIVKDGSSNSFAISTITAGSTQSCLADTNHSSGNIYCWGANGPDGLLGNNGSTNPYDTVGSFRFYVLFGGSGSQFGHATNRLSDSIVAGKNFTCAIINNSYASNSYANACWGRNESRQLADGTTANSKKAVSSTNGALSGKRIIKTSVGDNHACSIIADNQLVCWGMGANGRIGNDSSTNQNPVVIGGLLANKTVTDVSAGGDHTCAIADGLIYCWGMGANGRLGTESPSDQSMPTKVPKYIIGTGISVAPSNITY